LEASEDLGKPRPLLKVFSGSEQFFFNRMKMAVISCILQCVVFRNYLKGEVL
jgi:hypothetical protein